MSVPYPEMPRELAEIIATHKALFGGFVMEADETQGEPETPQPQPEAKAPESEEPLGEAGKSALVAEREARQRAEEALAALSGLSKSKVRQFLTDARAGHDDQPEPKAEAPQPKPAEDDSAKYRQEAARFRLAATHGISVEDAEAFLTGADEEAMRAQAERFKARLKEESDKHRTTGLVDPTQGQGSTAVAVAPGVPRLAAAFDSEITS